MNRSAEIEASIWRDLKQGSLGIVLWALRRDERVVQSFSEALGELDSVERLAAALHYSVFAATNSIGQVALHELAADAALQPHVETRDCRWSPLRTLPEGTLEAISLQIASQPDFVALMRRLLGKTVLSIKAGDLRKVGRLGAHADTSALYQQFLIRLGVGLAGLLRAQNKTLVGVLGEVAGLSESTDAPLYSFGIRGRDVGSYSGSRRPQDH